MLRRVCHPRRYHSSFRHQEASRQMWSWSGLVRNRYGCADDNCIHHRILLCNVLMSDLKSVLRIKSIVLISIVGIIVLVFLYFYNPQDISFFPRCPFYALTGYKCPGCGTLRAMHALLHFQVAIAFKLNPFLFFSIPVIVGMLVSRRFALNVTLGRCLLVVTIGYWILRNVFD